MEVQVDIQRWERSRGGSIIVLVSFKGLAVANNYRWRSKYGKQDAGWSLASGVDAPVLRELTPVINEAIKAGSAGETRRQLLALMNSMEGFR